MGTCGIYLLTAIRPMPYFCFRGHGFKWETISINKMSSINYGAYKPISSRHAQIACSINVMQMAKGADAGERWFHVTVCWWSASTEIGRSHDNAAAAKLLIISECSRLSVCCINTLMIWNMKRPPVEEQCDRGRVTLTMWNLVLVSASAVIARLSDEDRGTFNKLLL